MARNQSIIQVGWKQNLKIKILTENALEYLASGKGFILDRLRLDILTKILNKIFN